MDAGKYHLLEFAYGGTMDIFLIWKVRLAAMQLPRHMCIQIPQLCKINKFSMSAIHDLIFSYKE